ncbi:DinB family protein [Reichenbachiella versicolor]|uniref:DinB family protein n=1 Tax=Reichenbachiella versicolor TaxID=1821036 RepID=UPI000D6EA7BF|nr:DinB family protein [Reichenbachiella versicolor]
MTDKLQKLINAAIESFEGDLWLGDSLMGKLNDIDFKSVNRSLPNSTNSIAKIVQHIINWRVFMLEKLNDNHSFDIVLNTDNDWTDITINSESEWKSLLEKLISTQNELIQFLESLDSDDFLNRITSGKEYSFEYLIEGIIQHDIYHSGQIGLIYASVK